MRGVEGAGQQRASALVTRDGRHIWPQDRWVLEGREQGEHEEAPTNGADEKARDEDDLHALLLFGRVGGGGLSNGFPLA